MLDRGDFISTGNVSSALNFEGDSRSNVHSLAWTVALGETSDKEVTMFNRLLAGTGSVGANSRREPDANGPLDAHVGIVPGETSNTVSFGISGDPDEPVFEEFPPRTRTWPTERRRCAPWVGSSTTNGTGNNLALHAFRLLVIKGDRGHAEVSLSRPAPKLSGACRGLPDFHQRARLRGLPDLGLGPIFGNADVNPKDFLRAASPRRAPSPWPRPAWSRPSSLSSKG